MQISSIVPNPISPPVHQNTRVQDFQAIQKALDSGDLVGAQAAFAQFKQDFHATHNGRNLGQTNVPSAIKDDLRGLQEVLNAGDLSGSQSAFAQLKADLQSLWIKPTPTPFAQPASTGGGSAINVLA